MKHPELLSLKYDGQAEKEIKEKKPHVYKRYLKEINHLAINLVKQFPENKDLFFVEIAKRGFEIAYKRSIDAATRDIAINLFDKLSGIDGFVDYMKAIKVGRYLTKRLTLSYINPIKPAKNGLVTKICEQNELGEAPFKTIVIDADQLLGLIEEVLANHLNIDGLEQVKNFKVSKPALFGKNNNTDERFYAQYAKAACQEITNYMQNSSIPDNDKKEICISVLEHFCLIERYEDYVKRKQEEQKKSKEVVEIIKRTLWVSRAFSSHNKNS